MRGAATLPLRMRCHQDNALVVAKYLESHSAVEIIRYPGLKSHPQHTLALRQMDNFSGMIAFRVKRPVNTARKMMDRLQIIHYAVSLGHHRSLIYLMETEDLIQNSFKLENNELKKYRDIAGDGIFRLSVGLEDYADLVHDLDNVL